MLFLNFSAKFLIKLDLREYPNLSKILKLFALSTEREICNKTLNYFINNFEKNYFNEYKIVIITNAFLSYAKPSIYAKLSEYYINSDCVIMEFNVIDKDYKDKVEKLGIQQHPNSDKLIEQLIENKPKIEREAKNIFEYLET